MKDGAAHLPWHGMVGKDDIIMKEDGGMHTVDAKGCREMVQGDNAGMQRHAKKDNV